MSNFTKYYTKDGKKYAAYFDDLRSEYEITFSAIDDPYLEKQLFGTGNCYSTPEFDKFIEDNQYEEVMDDYKTPESKLYSKVDTPLEKLKDQLKKLQESKPHMDCRSSSVNLYDDLMRSDKTAQNLVNAIEEYTLIPRGKEDDKISDIFLFNVDEKIAEFNKKNEVKFEPLKAEELQVKEDVKLPEVGKRYRQKSSKQKFKVSKIEGDYITVRDYDCNKQTVRLRDFWLNYEELPEDNIEKPTGYIIDKDKVDEIIFRHNSHFEKPKSIWKDISELPGAVDVSKTYLVKSSNGTIAVAVFDFYGETYINPRFQINGVIQYEVTNWVELTDYINNTENFQQEVLERLKKLEGK